MTKCGFLIISLNIFGFIQVAYSLEKCCDGDFGIVIQNNSYICENGTSLEVSTTQARAECKEAFGTSIAVFSVTSGGYNLERNITDLLTRKCCPRRFRYDAQTHACASHNLEIGNWGQIIPVGLSHCSVIKDYKVSSMTDGLAVINDTHLRLDQFSRVIEMSRACLDEMTCDGFIVRICEDIEICKTTKCIHKCCPNGQSFVNGSSVRGIFMIFGKMFSKCTNHSYIKMLKFSKICDGGTFFVWDSNGNRTYPSSEGSYSFEHATKGSRILGYVLFRFFPDIEDVPLKTKFLGNGCCFDNLLSQMFAGYFAVHMGNDGFWTISRHNDCVLHLHEGNKESVWKMLGQLVLCTFDPICAACSVSPIQESIVRKKTHFCLQDIRSSSNYTIVDKKKRDSLYGWAMPILLTSLPALFHYLTLIKVEMAITKCIIEKNGNYAEIVFRIIPLSVIQVIDIGLFAEAIIYCLKNNVKKKKFFVKQERLGLVLKLSVAMGMLFLFELLSSFTDFRSNPITATIEIIWDVINCLQGEII
nr:unnamed protein product [Callosobruchus analis]